MRAAGDRQQEAEARAERRSDGDGRDADAMIEGECAGRAECVLDRWIVESGLLTRLTVLRIVIRGLTFCVRARMRDVRRVRY